MSSATVPTRCCESCGKPLERKQYPGGFKESLHDLARRRFCNHACKGAAQLIESPVNGVKARGRKGARKITPRVACARCGRRDRLEVHHKDENPTNNNPANLEVLCLWCHRRDHKNKGCSVPACSAPYRAAGYCNKHYYRFKKYGDPLVKRSGSGRPMKVPT